MAKFNASKELENVFSEDEEALHVWKTLQELLSASVSYTTMTTKLLIYMIPNTESDKFPKPGTDYAAVVYT